jgi:hypothetical protein
MGMDKITQGAAKSELIEYCLSDEIKKDERDLKLLGTILSWSCKKLLPFG